VAVDSFLQGSIASEGSRRLRSVGERAPMAIFSSLFALAGRFAGRLLNSALGWATILLFGKVDGSKQTLLLVIALASLLWLVVLAGIVIPDIGAFMLAFVPVPDFIDENVVRLAMLGIALALPLGIGIAAVTIAEPASRPKGASLAVAVLRGYPFTATLAVTIAILAVLALVRKARSIARRWEDAHVPVIVKPGGYDRVVADLERVIGATGIEVHRRPAPRLLSLPSRMLDAVAGSALGDLVPDRLMLLSGPALEVLVYPSDVAISGRKDEMARARAAIAKELTETPAYMTTSAEAERIEDVISEIARDDAPATSGRVTATRRRLRRLDAAIARLRVPFDEWETIYRQRLQVERDLLARRHETIVQPANVQAHHRRRGRLVWVGILGIVILEAVAAIVTSPLVARESRPSRR
jgi:hypothetical protein